MKFKFKRKEKQKDLLNRAYFLYLLPEDRNMEMSRRN